MFVLPFLFLTACGDGSPRTTGGDSTITATAIHKITMPQPPSVLSDDDKLTYVVERYWDSFDFADSTWLCDTAALEQVFADWAYLLGNIPASEASEYPGMLIRKSEQSPSMLLRLAELAEKYFADPNSPYRSEELFIPVLETVIAAPGLDTLCKLRPRSLLASALKNRPGETAADITYTTAGGTAGTLHGVRADYTLLMFYNPGCPECARIETYIPQSEVFAPLVASGAMKVLAVYPDEDLAAWREHLPQMPSGWIVGHRVTGRDAGSPYDLPAIPSLYLLDKGKRVILKDAPVERIEAWLSEHASPQIH